MYPDASPDQLIMHALCLPFNCPSVQSQVQSDLGLLWPQPEFTQHQLRRESFTSGEFLRVMIGRIFTIAI